MAHERKFVVYGQEFLKTTIASIEGSLMLRKNKAYPMVRYSASKCHKSAIVNPATETMNFV